MLYLFQRALQMLFILALLSAALFGLLSLMPGNPVDLLITSNPSIRPEDVLRLKKIRGLDKPWYVQYTRWLWGYNEPLKPAEISYIDAIKFDDTKDKIAIDISNYIYDPNYMPSEQLAHKWLLEIWPEVKKTEYYESLLSLAKEANWSEFLLVLGNNSTLMQEQFLQKIKIKSRETIKVVGLFDTQADDFLLTRPKASKHQGLWFYLINSYNQKKLSYIEVVNNPYQPKIKLVNTIKTQLLYDEDKPFTLDLNKFVAANITGKLKFSLYESSIGQIDELGVYSHKFIDDGMSVLLFKATDEEDNTQYFAVDIEHGVLKNQNKFNKGFLYAFLGDKQALGFSQTYKRPVYDLLFGNPVICGDNKLDPGETCDDGNNKSGDGCASSCFLESNSTMEKINASVGGYIVTSGRIGNTIQLMLPAILLSLLFAIPLGIFSAYRQYSLLDYIINFLAFIGISLPVFWFGIMMVYLFSEVLMLFPAGGVQTPGIYAQGVWAVLLDRLKYAVLPTVVLSIFYTGIWLRYMRSSMLEVLPKDFIRTARAKGLSERIVILKHAFRNALIPVVTVLALSIPSLFGGAVLTETVFSWPGIGRLQYDAVINNDYYVAIVVFLISAMLVMLGNLLADTVYIMIDPRIRKR